MRKNQQGFSRVLLLITLIILVIGIGVDFLWWKNSHGLTLPSLKTTNQVSTLPDCNGKTLLKNSPIPPATLSSLTPLGNVWPPQHILPTPHMYYTAKQETNVVAPADAVISSISLLDSPKTTGTPYNSYRIDFSVCKQVGGYYIYMLTLAPKLQAAYDHPKQLNGANHEVDLSVVDNEVLGTTGSAPGTNLPKGLDVGMWDTRSVAKVASPQRYVGFDLNIVCSLDYYPSNISDLLTSLLTDPDEPSSSFKRDDHPCGLPFQDLPGTAQGVWFSSDFPKDKSTDPSFDNQLALIHAMYDHSIQEFAFGNKAKQIGLDPTHIFKFIPSTSGKINQDFSQVQTGVTYCYETNGRTFNDWPEKAILIQLLSNNELTVGTLSSSTCGNGPWKITQGLTYIR